MSMTGRYYEEFEFNWSSFEEYTARVTAEFRRAEEERTRSAESFSNYEYAVFEAFEDWF
jgi:hypothetical protein